MPLVEDYDKIDPQRSLEIYRERFADASDFTFYFIGSFKEEEIKPLLETYIASLPSQNKKEKLKDLGVRAPKDYKEHYVHRGTDPKSFISLYFEGPAVFDQDEAHLMWTLTEYLKLKYFDVLREEMSGVYGFNVYGGLGNVPWQHGNLGIVIPCAPENVDKLVEAALKEVKDVKANGVSDSYIQKLKTTQQKSFEREIKENRHWLYQLIEIQRRGENYDRLANRQRQIDLITSEAIQAVAQKYIDPENYVKVVLYPEGMAITDK